MYMPLVMRPYTGNYPVQLTLEAVNDTQPILSPNGKTVIFVSDRDGLADIFSMPLARTQAVNLTQTPNWQEDTPVWSPDGKMVAYAAKSVTSEQWNIYLMDPDGTHKWLAFANATHPSFMLDGQGMVFASPQAGNWDIYSATLSSSVTAWVRLTTDPATDRFPQVSPDGSTIVFRSERDGNSNVYLMNADGSNQRRFTSSPAWDGHGAYTPDMNGILFDSDRSGAWGTFLADLTGTVVVAYEQRPGWQMLHSNISRGGQWCIYAGAQPEGNYNLYLDRFTK